MTIVEAARAWLGRNFRPGVPEQCMNWVRQVLKDVNHKQANAVTTQPIDGLWTGPGLASSLAGPDLGKIKTAIKDFKPGDIVFFENSYGDYPEGTITHVGIYEGNRAFLHRSTKSAPVARESLDNPYWYSLLKCAVELNGSTKPEPVNQNQKENWKAYWRPGASKVLPNGNFHLALNFQDGKLVAAKINHRPINPAKLVAGTIELVEEE